MAHKRYNAFCHTVCLQHEGPHSRSRNKEKGGDSQNSGRPGKGGQETKKGRKSPGWSGLTRFSRERNRKRRITNPSLRRRGALTQNHVSAKRHSSGFEERRNLRMCRVKERAEACANMLRKAAPGPPGPCSRDFIKRKKRSESCAAKSQTTPRGKGQKTDID